MISPKPIPLPAQSVQQEREEKNFLIMMASSSIPISATATTLSSPLAFFTTPTRPNSIFGAQFAPLSSPLATNAPPPQHSTAFWTRYFRRGISPSQWDLDYVCYQLINSCRAPGRVYKLTLHRKQTKNQWARDDPAFASILLGFLAVVAFAYGIAYRYTSPFAYIWLIVHFWTTFIGWGLVIATLGWFFTNRYGRINTNLPHSVEQSVEWLFAWDIHCNSFVPILLLVYVANFLLLPLIMMSDGLIPCLVGNTLYATAIGYYLYITFQGYVILPFLQHDKLRPLLVGIVISAVLGVAATLLHINIAAMMVSLAVS